MWIKDGKQEIVISEVKKAGFSYFNRLRLYDSGAIVSLAWNGSSLNESWRTGNFRGYMAGYDFALLNEAANGRKSRKDDTQTRIRAIICRASAEKRLSGRFITRWGRDGIYSL